MYVRAAVTPVLRLRKPFFLKNPREIFPKKRTLSVGLPTGRTRSKNSQIFSRWTVHGGQHARPNRHDAGVIGRALAIASLRAYVSSLHYWGVRTRPNVIGGGGAQESATADLDVHNPLNIGS
jgi:hypothetical protein